MGRRGQRITGLSHITVAGAAGAAATALAFDTRNTMIQCHVQQGIAALRPAYLAIAVGLYESNLYHAPKIVTAPLALCSRYR